MSSLTSLSFLPASGFRHQVHGIASLASAQSGLLWYAFVKWVWPSRFFQGLQALVGRLASLASAWVAFVGIITFLTSACAAAAWPLAIVNLMMFDYASSAAAGIAAFLVLYRVFIRVSAAAARLLALLGVILKSGSSGACSAKVKSVWLLFGDLPRVAFGYAPPPSLCEWDASCQSVPGHGYPTLGFFFSAAAAFIVIAIGSVALCAQVLATNGRKNVF